MAERTEIDGDWLRGWAARNLPGGSPARVELEQAAQALDELPRLRKLAAAAPSAAPAPMGIEASLQSIARSLDTVVTRMGGGDGP